MIFTPVLTRNIFFHSLLAFGLTYISFLIIFVSQTFSGFIMQIIFLFDTINFNSQDIFALVFSSDFLINFFSGLLSFVLVFLFIRSIFITIIKIFITRKYINSLKVISHKNYFIFDSSFPHAFTAGLLCPQIFISSKLLQISTAKEIKAVFLHELFHKLSYDPSKDLYVNFLSDALPFFPLRNWFFGQYYIIKENCCDFFAENKIFDKKPLISALLKIHSVYVPKLNVLSHFSAQSERIKILVGQKTYHSLSPLSYSFFSVVFLVLSINFVSKSNVFYHCQHLDQCLEAFISSKSHNLPSCH